MSERIQAHGPIIGFLTDLLSGQRSLVVRLSPGLDHVTVEIHKSGMPPKALNFTFEDAESVGQWLIEAGKTGRRNTTIRMGADFVKLPLVAVGGILSSAMKGEAKPMSTEPQTNTENTPPPPEQKPEAEGSTPAPAGDAAQATEESQPAQEERTQ